ncbi:hypothetical protein AURDEDRAFT_165875 [Auricularia subglabra TFB-10046 SS5]|nr:hypothetical protein AURDEDRAFT_165875 [Auricularia subglabra TFB-10046 SS5]
MSNLPFAKEVLSHSKNLPISLHLTTHAVRLARTFVGDFESVLAPHCSRLVSFHIRYLDKALLSDICRFLEMLPALKTLTLRCLFSVGGHPYGIDEHWQIPFPPRALNLPALEELVLDSELLWSAEHAASFPSLRALTVTLREDDDLIAMAAACPALQVLHIPVDCASLFCPEDSFEQLNYIPAVIIHNECMNSRYLRSFIRARRRFLELKWDSESDSPYKALDIINKFFPSFSIFCELDDDNDYLRLCCSDPDGNQRVLSSWDPLSGLNKSFPIWKHLSPSSLLGLSIQPRLWYSSTRTLPAAPALTNLSFLLSSPADLAAISHAPWTKRHPATVFVSLTSLCLRAWSCVGPVSLLAAEVSPVVRALDLSRPLPSLVLHGVVLDDPSAVEGVTTITQSVDSSLPFTPVI